MLAANSIRTHTHTYTHTRATIDSHVQTHLTEFVGGEQLFARGCEQEAGTLMQEVGVRARALCGKLHDVISQGRIG